MSEKVNNEKGFTLIELLVVLVILGILTTVVVLNIVDEPEKAKKQKVVLDIKKFETALKMFKIDNGFYPSTEQGLEALVTEPNTGRAPENYKQGGYIDGLPLDPWNGPYVYVSPGPQGRNYGIVSLGADGVEGGEGFDEDIASWNLN